MAAATIEAFSDCMCPTRERKSTMIGIEPSISITANRIIPAVIISLKSSSMTFFMQSY